MTQVVSSISGLEIYSPSAGYAPTNSGDVSAIASAYQVVSATATQLYAGTAYLTSVNGAPVSASRAGQAANASMATSAYYDGTGRLISALPDSAAVSSIASSYAESAASSKADSSALSSYALSSDVSGVIDTVSSNSASWSAGTLPISGSAGNDSATYGAGYVEYTRYDTAGEPDIRTAILSPDSLWIDYTLDGNDHTSMTLNESMLDFGDSDGDHIVDAYSIDSWNSAVDTVANNSATWGQGGVDSATVSAIASSYAESAVSSKADSSALSSYAKSADVSAAVNKVTSMSGNWNTTYNTVFYNSAYWTTGYTTVRDNSASWGQSGVDSATVSSIASSYAESAASGKADSSSLSSYALSSDVSGVIDTVYSNSASWSGGSLPISGSSSNDSATYDVNGIVYEHESTDEFDPHRDALISVDSFGISHVTPGGDFYGVNLTDTGLSFIDQDGYHTIEASSIDSWNSAVETVANNSATWGQGGVDSATVSSIASSYAESAASSKMDTSAMTSYALSADVSGTVDVVSTQSANWGGSALALSAGPGVSLTKSGNTLIAGLDETVLWSGAGSTTGSTINLSESLENFERYGIYYYIPYGECGSHYIEKCYSAGSTAFNMTTMQCAPTLVRCFCDYGSMNETSISLVSGRQAGVWFTGASVDWYDGADRHHTITKIVGINRTAGV